MGPRAREVLAQVSDEDVSHKGFPFATCREIRVAGVAVWVLRVTYVGELGWELHIPKQRCTEVYGALMAVGEPLGLRNAGYRAIESLRLEKGYRAWGADIGPDHTPLEAGLGWAVKLASQIPFKGRAALQQQQEQGLSKRLACFTLADPTVILLGRETLYRDGERVGWLTSGGWGYTLACNIGYGYVRNAAGVDESYLRAGNYELEVATERVPCEIHLRALYDPKMARIKC
jgi:4-methylaminobutanoate oxidase (formaldehyde-forming)